MENIPIGSTPEGIKEHNGRYTITFNKHDDDDNDDDILACQRRMSSYKHDNMLQKYVRIIREKLFNFR